MLAPILAQQANAGEQSNEASGNSRKLAKLPLCSKIQKPKR